MDSMFCIFLLIEPNSSLSSRGWRELPQLLFSKCIKNLKQRVQISDITCLCLGVNADKKYTEYKTDETNSWFLRI